MADGLSQSAGAIAGAERRHADSAEQTAYDELVDAVDGRHEAERQAVQLEVGVERPLHRGEIAEDGERQQKRDRHADVDADLRQHLHQRQHAFADVCPGRGHGAHHDGDDEQEIDGDAGQREGDVSAVARVLGEGDGLADRARAGSSDRRRESCGAPALPPGRETRASFAANRRRTMSRNCRCAVAPQSAHTRRRRRRRASHLQNHNRPPAPAGNTSSAAQAADSATGLSR